MAAAGETLLGSSVGEQDSFFIQMERRFTTIVKILGAYDRVQNETWSAFAGFEQTVARMHECVAEIREIEIRIRRLAINATVRVAQIGAAGDPLQVLAEALHRLAQDAQRITGEVTGSLNTITSAVHELTGCGTASKDAELTRHQVRATILELHSSCESSFSRLNQILALSSRLHDGIQIGQGRFLAGAVFSRAIQSASKGLEEIAPPGRPSTLRRNHCERRAAPGRLRGPLHHAV